MTSNTCTSSSLHRPASIGGLQHIWDCKTQVQGTALSRCCTRTDLQHYLSHGSVWTAQICMQGDCASLQVCQNRKDLYRICASPTYTRLCPAKAAKLFGYTVQCRMFLLQIHKILLYYMSAIFSKCGVVHECTYADPSSPKQDGHCNACEDTPDTVLL